MLKVIISIFIIIKHLHPFLPNFIIILRFILNFNVKILFLLSLYFPTIYLTLRTLLARKNLDCVIRQLASPITLMHFLITEHCCKLFAKVRMALKKFYWIFTNKFWQLYLKGKRVYIQW